MNDKIINFLLERLQEPSTWRGLIWLITAFGFALDPDQREAIVTTGMSLVGLIGVFTSEHKKETPVVEEPTPEEVKVVQTNQQNKTTKALEDNKKKKNAKPKKSDPNNFFND